MYFRQPVSLLIKLDARPLCTTRQALMAGFSVNKWFHHLRGRVTHYAWHSRPVKLCIETHKTPLVRSKHSRVTVVRLRLEPNLPDLLHRGPWGSGDLTSAHFSGIADLRWVMSSQIRRSASLYLWIKSRFQVVQVRDAFKLGQRCISQGEETLGWYDCWAERVWPRACLIMNTSGSQSAMWPVFIHAGMLAVKRCHRSDTQMSSPPPDSVSHPQRPLPIQKC